MTSSLLPDSCQNTSTPPGWKLGENEHRARSEGLGTTLIVHVNLDEPVKRRKAKCNGPVRAKGKQHGEIGLGEVRNHPRDSNGTRIFSEKREFWFSGLEEWRQIISTNLSVVFGSVFITLEKIQNSFLCGQAWPTVNNNPSRKRSFSKTL